MDYTEAGYKIYGLWCEAGRPGTPEWGVSSIANIIRELDSKVIEPVTQAAPVSPRKESPDPMNPANLKVNAGLVSTFWKGYCEMYKVNEGATVLDWWGFEWAGYALARYEKLKLDSVTLTPSSKEKI